MRQMRGPEDLCDAKTWGRMHRRSRSERAASMGNYSREAAETEAPPSRLCVRQTLLRWTKRQQGISRRADTVTEWEQYAETLHIQPLKN